MLKVSVIVPTYNRPEFLYQNVDSFLNQEYDNKELVVVDDGSHKKYLEDMEKAVPQRRYIKFLHKKNGGCPSALNYGINNSESDLICVLGDDDLFEGTLSLSNRVQAFIHNPEVEVIYTAANVVDGGNRIMSVTPAEPVSIKRILKQDYINIHSMMWRRSIHEKIGLFEEDMISNEDWEFKIKCLMECEVKALDFVSVRYRRHGEMKSMKNHANGIMGECYLKMKERLDKRYENNIDYFTLQ